MESFENDPISRVKWVDVRELTPNDYNPNVVLSQELKLLEFSILTQGWIQPLLATEDGILIDGYHRYWLSINSKDIVRRYQYMAPVVEMKLTPEERIFLTIRINRAKGNHSAYKMHEAVARLIGEYGVPKARIMKEIGATKEEVELLIKDGVFASLDVENHEYSEAWEPER